MKTNGDIIREHAESLGISPCSLCEVKSFIVAAKTKGADPSAARLMLHHGRLTDEARAWLSQEYPQIISGELTR